MQLTKIHQLLANNGAKTSQRKKTRDPKTPSSSSGLTIFHDTQNARPFHTGQQVLRSKKKRKEKCKKEEMKSKKSKKKSCGLVKHLCHLLCSSRRWWDRMRWLYASLKVLLEVSIFM
jgi:hypothetical protein